MHASRYSANEGPPASNRQGSAPPVSDERRDEEFAQPKEPLMNANVHRQSCLPGQSDSSGAIHRIPVVDTHVHCFAGKDDRRFPYHADGPYRPQAASTPERLLRLMDAADVDFAILVQPEPYQDDHRYLEHCLTAGSGRLLGTCLFFAGQPRTAHDLRALVDRMPIVALRIHAYNPERLPPFATTEFKNLWRIAADLGLAIQLHFEPRYAPGFEPCLREFPKVPVLADHLGRPFQGSPQEYHQVLRWADFDNVIMKLSCVPQPTVYPHRDPEPIVRSLAAAFGIERLMHGGGFDENVTVSGYREAFTRTADLLPFASQTERAMVLGGNAARLFGLTRRT